MRDLASTISSILTEIPTNRSTQDFIDSLVKIRDIAPFIPAESIESYWDKLTDLIITTLHPEESGLQTWEQNVVNILIGL